MNKGYTILSIREEKSWFKRLSLGKVSAKDRSVTYRELSTMLKAGVSITQAVDIVSESPNRKLREVFRDISKSLENGFPLSVSMAGHPKTFPIVEVGVVKAGEATGNLSVVLKQLAESTARSAEFTGKVKGAMVYPAFIIVVMGIIGVIIMTRVIPPIKEIFEASDADLPVATTVLLAITDFLTASWYWAILILVALVALIKLFLMTKKGKETGSWLGLNFPVFGPLIQQVFLANFNRTLSLLISAGVPIIEAINIITESSGNTIFRRSLVNLSKSLEQGASITSSLKANKYFPKIMTQLLFVGQQSGDLSGTSATLADFFESEVDAKLRTFSALIEPFIMVMLGGAVAFIVIAVLQPIYNLTGQF